MPQSLSNVIVHLVFSTFHRDPTLTTPIREELYPYLTGALKKHGCRVIQAGGVDDHVHLLFAQSRTESMSDIVGSIKGSSSIWIKEQQVGRRDFAWQAGYGAFSIGFRDVTREVAYIQNQESRHKETTFMDEFRELMDLAGLEIDEKYAWD